MKRRMWRQRGARIFLAWHTETIDGRADYHFPQEADRKVAANVLVRASRVVWRRGVRTLHGLARHARITCTGPHADRVLPRAGQPSLLPPQPLLLSIVPYSFLPILVVFEG